MKKIVSEEEKNIWKQRYLNGETARNIAKDFPQYNETTISRHIKKMGISRGKGKIAEYKDLEEIIIQEYQDDKMATCSSLSLKYKINDRTISKWLKNHNIPIKQNSGYISKADQNYFKIIDTPSKAYLLGFITADGAVTGKVKEKPTSCSIEVQEKDKNIILFAQKEINPFATITNCHYKGKNNLRISFNGVQLCSYLERYGIVQNKSKTIKEVPYDLIPKELLCFYFRGLIDGDGCIGKRGQVSIYSGSKDFLISVQTILCNELDLKKLKIYQGTAYFLTWTSKEDREKLFNFLYKDNLNMTYYYERKYNRLYNSLYANTEVTSQITQG